jgi:hypothetical protein
MTPLRTTLALMLLMVAVMLAVGCAGNVSEGTSDEITGTKVPIPASTQCMVTNNTSYWIAIDPIGDKFIGDKFIVIARTNIPVGEEIIVEVATTSMHCTKARCYFVDENSTVKVVQDNNCFNKTIAYVNASNFKPDEFALWESSATRRITTYRLFNILTTEVFTPNLHPIR